MTKLPLVLVLSLVVTACGTLPHAPKRTDLHTTYVWPTEVCPSVAAGTAGEPRSLGAVLLSTLLGNVLSGLVGIPAAALSAAADADANGLKATGTNARFFYQVQRTTDAAGKPVINVINPGCYVVAYAEPVATAKSWCADPEFSKSAPATCSTGKSALDQLKVREQLTPSIRQPGIDTLAVPEFYAEIAFEQSGAPDVVRPYIAAIHYPRSIIDPNSDKARMVTLALELTSAQKDDPMKAATVSMILPTVRPGIPVDAASTARAITGWTSIPSKFTITPPDPKDGNKVPFMPVTIKASLNEVGDPSKFLQAFAKAFGASAGDYSKAITAEISPVGQASAQQDQDKKVADYQTAVATALKSRADAITACVAAPTTPQAKVAAESQFTSAVANQLKANLAADQAGLQRRFNPGDKIEGFTQCW